METTTENKIDAARGVVKEQEPKQPTTKEKSHDKNNPERTDDRARKAGV